MNPIIPTIRINATTPPTIPPINTALFLSADDLSDCVVKKEAIAVRIIVDVDSRVKFVSVSVGDVIAVEFASFAVDDGATRVGDVPSDRVLFVAKVPVTPLFVAVGIVGALVDGGTAQTTQRATNSAADGTCGVHLASCHLEFELSLNPTQSSTISPL